MISPLRSLGVKCLALLAVLIVCLLPAGAQAEMITITNTTSAPLVIVITFVAGGRPQRSPPIKLAAGMASAPLSVPGNKIISVLDPAAPARPVAQQAVPGMVQDQFWDIAVGNGPKPQVQVVPGKPPKSP